MSLVVLKVRLMTFLIFSSELDSKLKELVYLYSNLKFERADECLDFYLKSLFYLGLEINSAVLYNAKSVRNIR
jgi:hypothetical protein